MRFTMFVLAALAMPMPVAAQSFSFDPCRTHSPDRTLFVPTSVTPTLTSSSEDYYFTPGTYLQCNAFVHDLWFSAASESVALSAGVYDAPGTNLRGQYLALPQNRADCEGLVVQRRLYRRQAPNSSNQDYSSFQSQAVVREEGVWNASTNSCSLTQTSSSGTWPSALGFSGYFGYTVWRVAVYAYNRNGTYLQVATEAVGSSGPR